MQLRKVVIHIHHALNQPIQCLIMPMFPHIRCIAAAKLPGCTVRLKAKERRHLKNITTTALPNRGFGDIDVFWRPVALVGARRRTGLATRLGIRGVTAFVPMWYPSLSREFLQNVSKGYLRRTDILRGERPCNGGQPHEEQMRTRHSCPSGYRYGERRRHC